MGAFGKAVPGFHVIAVQDLVDLVTHGGIDLVGRFRVVPGEKVFSFFPGEDEVPVLLAGVAEEEQAGNGDFRSEGDIQVLVHRGFVENLIAFHNGGLGTDGDFGGSGFYSAEGKAGGIAGSIDGFVTDGSVIPL